MSPPQPPAVSGPGGGSKTPDNGPASQANPRPAPADEPEFTGNDIRLDGRRAHRAADLPAGISVKFSGRSQGNTVRLTTGPKVKGLVVDLSSAVDCTVEMGRIRVNFGGRRNSFVSNSGTSPAASR